MSLLSAVTVGVLQCCNSTPRSFSIKYIAYVWAVRLHAALVCNGRQRWGCAHDRAKEQPYIASMGIYVAKASAIRDLLLNHFPEVGSHFYEYILDIQKSSKFFQ